MKSTLIPAVCAHAGCEDTPRDGLESIAAGIAAGADGVEIDLRFGPRGEPVLFGTPEGERSEDTAGRMLSLGVDSITTNRVADLRRMLS